MSKSQRDKGKRGELEVAHILQDHGWSDAKRTQQFSGKAGTADVDGIDGLHIEVKRCERYDIRRWIEQSEHDAEADGNGDIPVVVFRSSGEPWRICLEFEEFLKLIRR